MEPVVKRRHGLEPMGAVHSKTLQNRLQMIRNASGFALSNLPPRPIDKIQIWIRRDRQSAFGPRMGAVFHMLFIPD